MSLTQIGEMSIQELSLWAAFIQHHDPGRRDDARAAMLAATIANCHSTGRRFEVSDFMPRAAVEISEEQAAASLKLWAARCGRVKKRE